MTDALNARRHANALAHRGEIVDKSLTNSLLH